MSLTIARWFFYLCCTVNVGVQTLFFTHMIQLNGYSPKRFYRWCRVNAPRVMSTRRYVMLVPAAAGALVMISGARAWLLYLIGVSVVLNALMNLPSKAKKPLVYTARVKRLLTTTVILWLLVGVLTWWMPVWLGALLILALSALAVWWAMAANAINQPIETGIQQYYIRDAKRLLKSKADMPVIGITGSYGKTSTKNYLTALLSTRYNVLMTPESYNTPMGIVRTIREHLKPSHQIFVCEMGACRVGEIKELCDLVHPTYGLITSIGEQHLETFGSVQNIIDTKFELADALPAGGFVVVNEDNDYIHNRETAVRRIGYSVDGQADYIATDMSVSANGSSFIVTAPDGESRRFTTKLLGAHNIQNLTGCIAVAHTLGIPLEELVYPVRMIKPVAHRLQMLPNGFIDDAFNSNPAGFRAALDVLSAFSGERVLVTPGMVELGDVQEIRNRELGEYAATRCDRAILVGQKQAPPLKAGLLAGGFPENQIAVVNSLNEALDIIKRLPLDNERIVLLENDLPDSY